MFWVSFLGLHQVKRKRESLIDSIQNPSSKQFALYIFPLGWLALFFVSLLKFNISYVYPLLAHGHPLFYEEALKH